MAVEIQERRDASNCRVLASYRVTGRVCVLSDTLGESSGGGSILEAQWRLSAHLDQTPRWSEMIIQTPFTDHGN